VRVAIMLLLVHKLWMAGYTQEQAAATPLPTTHHRPTSTEQ